MRACVVWMRLEAPPERWNRAARPVVVAEILARGVGIARRTRPSDAAAVTVIAIVMPIMTAAFVAVGAQRCDAARGNRRFTLQRARRRSRRQREGQTSRGQQRKNKLVHWSSFQCACSHNANTKGPFPSV